MSQTLNIGILGFGVVGQGFYEIFTQNRPEGFSIQRIAAKNPGKERQPLEAVIEYEAEAIVDDKRIDIVVEAINDAQTAYHLAKRALSNGKHVISANKQMLASHFPELVKIAQHQGVTLLFEGAVGGVIPILQNLKNYHKNDRISSIEAIINGSSNYILTQLFETERSYNQAVKEAQTKGFAELNPAEDVGGHDAAAKLSLITSLAFNTYLDTSQITTLGIENIQNADIAFAQQFDLSIKQIGKIQRFNEKLSAYVLPSFVSQSNPLYHIKNEFNALKIVGSNSGEQVLSGKGAGKLPTGFAVYNDLLKVHTEHPSSITAAPTAHQAHNPILSVYVRLGSYNLALKTAGFEVIEQLEPRTFLAEIALNNLLAFSKKPVSQSVLVIEASALTERETTSLRKVALTET